MSGPQRDTPFLAHGQEQENGNGRAAHLGFLGRPTVLGDPVVGSDSSLDFRSGEAAQEVLVLHSDSLDVTGPLTIEAWVRLEPGFSEVGFGFIVAKHFAGTGYALLTQGTGSDRRFVLETNLVDRSRQVIGVSAPVAGHWTHVAGVWTGGLGRLYVNGRLESAAPVPEAPISNTVDLRIGSSLFGRQYNWHGQIKEVRIWNLERSVFEIRRAMFNPPRGDEVGLQAYWKCDENAGTVIADATPHGNHGSLTNVGWSSGPHMLVWEDFRSADMYDEASQDP